MGENRAVNRSIIITLVIICFALAAVSTWTMAETIQKDRIIENKNSEIEVLKNQNNKLQTWLQTNITHYKSQVDSLNSQILSLNAQIQDLVNQKNQLQIWLDENRTLLEQTEALLQSNITYYEFQINHLNSQITTLQDEIFSLNAQLATIQAEYDAYMSAYQDLMDKVNHRWSYTNIESFITPQDDAVCDVVYHITGGWNNPSDWNEFWRDVKAMYDWVVNNVGYRYDGLYPILPYNPSGDLVFWDEMWQFPNETLDLGKGDCEDMAILLCSMIRCYCNMKYWIECIIIEGSTAGHVAVQIPVSKNQLVILDPAGKYYTHDSWGNIISKDITIEINNWLNFWKSEMGGDVRVARVFSDYIDKTFYSTDDYITWMYSRS